MKIVTIQFRNWKSDGEYGGREYSFQTELDLKPGDMVMAPTRQGTNKARVARVDVDPREVPAGMKLNTITEKALTKAERREQEILRSWDGWEAVDPEMSTEQLYARVESDTGYDAGDITSALQARHVRDEQSEKEVAVNG